MSATIPSGQIGFFEPKSVRTRKFSIGTHMHIPDDVHLRGRPQIREAGYLPPYSGVGLNCLLDLVADLRCLAAIKMGR
jgi:hypothetical protein